MKLQVEGRVKVKGKLEPREWEFNGNKGTTYALMVDNTYHGEWGACLNFKVSKELYNKVLVDTEYLLDAYYDTESGNGRMVIVDMIEAE